MSISTEKYIFMERIEKGIEKELTPDKPHHVFRLRHRDEGLFVTYLFPYESAELAKQYALKLVKDIPFDDIDGFGFSYEESFHEIFFTKKKYEPRPEDTEEYDLMLVHKRTDKGEPYIVVYNEDSEHLYPIETMKYPELFESKKFVDRFQTIRSKKFYDSCFSDKRGVKGAGK